MPLEEVPSFGGSGTLFSEDEFGNRVTPRASFITIREAGVISWPPRHDLLSYQRVLLAFLFLGRAAKSWKTRSVHKCIQLMPGSLTFICCSCAFVGYYVLRL